MTSEKLRVRSGPVRINVIADGPAGAALPILCVHGWPEIAQSWRHQIGYFARAGYRIAAMDVRGYGDSDAPREIEAYRMATICADVAAVIDSLGGRAVLFGHDWGAPIVWQTALRYPEKVAGVASLAVPYIPVGDVNPLDLMRAAANSQFFYQLYFQEPGVAEAELESDPDPLAKIYYTFSGALKDRFAGRKNIDAMYVDGVALPARFPDWMAAKGARAPYLDDLVMPDRFPDWMDEAHMAESRAAFRRSGWHGSLNRYRAQDIDFAERAPVAGRPLRHPSIFIGGMMDVSRGQMRGFDLYADPGQACTDFRGATLIEDAGHWIQQEAPDQTNVALHAFIRSLGE
jgi:pimeloyl-ACP methyl ester carboxylesterase